MALGVELQIVAIGPGLVVLIGSGATDVGGLERVGSFGAGCRAGTFGRARLARCGTGVSSS
jgi:hypothetical protein